MNISADIQVENVEQDRMNKKSCAQQLSHFQCRFCGLIYSDYYIADIHQMACTLTLRLTEMQREKQTNFESINSGNFITLSQRRKESRKFDMMQFLGLEMFPYSFFRKKLNKTGYKCRFCNIFTKEKSACISHQNNCHFLQVQVLNNYVTKMTSPNTFLIRKRQQGKLYALNHQQICFLPPNSTKAFKYYKCSFCTYTGLTLSLVEIHLEKYCAFLHQLSQTKPQKSQKHLNMSIFAEQYYKKKKYPRLKIICDSEEQHFSDEQLQCQVLDYFYKPKKEALESYQIIDSSDSINIELTVKQELYDDQKK